MYPLRKISMSMLTVNENDIPDITFEDFSSALKSVRPSVAEEDLEVYLKFNATFGTFQL